jgi:hypothetical protein
VYPEEAGKLQPLFLMCQLQFNTMKHLLMLSLSFLVITKAHLQSTELIGTIRDKVTQAPIAGVHVKLLIAGEEQLILSDERGHFNWPPQFDVTIDIEVSHVSYLGVQIKGLEVKTTSSQHILIELEMKAQALGVFEVTTNTRQELIQPIAGRRFDPSEIGKVPGNRNDIARMAGNFAGVMPADIRRNDIIIRGNSPSGLLWRLGGGNIVNPNHFSSLGSTGGAVSAINPTMLGVSKFYMGAFPGELGNLSSGAFDLQFRDGNTQKWKSSIALGGSSGLEANVEGPIANNQKSSMLLGYRYSFLDAMDRLGLNLTGLSAQPQYQDFSYHLNLGSMKWGTLHAFGILGNAKIEFPDGKNRGISTSGLSINGIAFQYNPGKTKLLSSTVVVNNLNSAYRKELITEQTVALLYNLREKEQKISWNTFFRQRIRPNSNLELGMQLDYTQVNFKNGKLLSTSTWEDQRDAAAGSILWQSYLQWEYNWTPKLKSTTCVRSMYWDWNQHWVWEPRLNFLWRPGKGHQVALAYAMQHQALASPIAFASIQSNTSLQWPNKMLPLLESQTWALDYLFLSKQNWNIKLSAYHQFLNRAAIEQSPTHYSSLNLGNQFRYTPRDSLQGKGKGFNQGIELSIEKRFSDKYYSTLAATLMNSKYRGSDGLLRNTAFNNRFMLNLAVGREWKNEKRRVWSLGLHTLWAGGAYFIPIDLERSKLNAGEVLDFKNAYQNHFPNVFRMDVRLGYRTAPKKGNWGLETYIDFLNTTAHINPLAVRYDIETQKIYTEHQIRFMPDVNIRMSF